MKGMPKLSNGSSKMKPGDIFILIKDFEKSQFVKYSSGLEVVFLGYLSKEGEAMVRTKGELTGTFMIPLTFLEPTGECIEWMRTSKSIIVPRKE